MVRLQKMHYHVSYRCLSSVSDNCEMKKFNWQNCNFSVDVLTENNEDKSGKVSCSYFTTRRGYHTKSVFCFVGPKQT